MPDLSHILFMQKERTLGIVLLFTLSVGWFSCIHKKALREIQIDSNARVDRIFVTFQTINDTVLLRDKFRKFDLEIIDFQPHLKIACLSYDSTKISPQLIAYRLKQRKEIVKVEFDRKYTP